MKNKNKYVFSNYSNNLFSPARLLKYLVKCPDDYYDKNSSATFDKLNLNERKEVANSLQSKRNFNHLYAYYAGDEKGQESFHNIHDPNFSKSGYLKKPLRKVVPFLYSEHLIRKIAEHHDFFSKDIRKLNFFFSCLNSENQQKLYNIFKEPLSRVVRSDEDVSQFIAVLKSESLICQFLIEHQTSIKVSHQSFFMNANRADDTLDLHNMATEQANLDRKPICSR